MMMIRTTAAPTTAPTIAQMYSSGKELWPRPVVSGLILPVVSGLILPVVSGLILPVVSGLILPVVSGLICPVVSGLLSVDRCEKNAGSRELFRAAQQPENTE